LSPGVPTSALGALAEAFERSGVDLAALGLAWARAMPLVTLVPAFGLRAVPAPARPLMGLALAACIFPALTPIVEESSRPWFVLALVEAARGVPIALAAAVPLWAATMAGGVADALRGAQDVQTAPTVEGRATPLGILLSLLASAMFLANGGPARAAAALAAHPVGDHPFVSAANDLVSGIALAVSIAGPLLAASVVLELAAALVARAATPAYVQSLLAPVRALGSLTVLALLFERLASVLARAVR
jgi:type III secretory pathway component EscT